LQVTLLRWRYAYEKTDMKLALYEKLLSIIDLESDRDYEILDLGCGYGHLLGVIAGIISGGSTLIGIDAMKNAVDQAKSLYPTIDFRNEKFIDSLNFSDSSFDFVISVDSLECISNKNALVAEVDRILRPNGKVLVAHWDWDTQVYNSSNKEILRKYVAAFSDWQQNWMDASDGQMGRRLWGLFQGSGLFKGRADSFTLIETEYEKGKYGYDRLHDLVDLVAGGVIHKNDYDLILKEMDSLNRRGQYFYTVNSYIYYGGKA
jgi:SAM-dependent methyltransferase